MNTSRLADTIKQVRRYVHGESSRAEYRVWLAEQVWEADNLADDELEDIYHLLEALDAEFTSGHWSESELKSELRDRVLSAPITPT